MGARRKPLDTRLAARRNANEQEYEWNLRTTALDAYERAGTHDPKWDSCQGFEKSFYPAFRKSLAYTRAVALIYACAAKDVPQTRADAKKWADEALALWPEVVKERGITVKLLTDAGDLTVEAQVLVGADRGTVTDQMFDALDKAMPGSATPLTFMGKQYIDWAWDARGGGFANTVTRDGWTKFSERLTTAEGLLVKAYDRNPADPAAATKMITVELGQGRGRDVMEKWFKRAVAADPDYIEAYDAKLYYLQPKWHGSVDDALGFARECLATRDWRGGVPFVMIRAHKDLARYAQNEEAYWRQPEVWKDLESAVEPPTRIWPHNANYRSICAYWAWRCGQWKRADAQFKILGDKLDPAPWGSRETAEKARDEAARHAAGG